MDAENKTSERLRDEAYVSAKKFFDFNYGKNIPNILIATAQEIAALRATAKESVDASNSLALELGRVRGIAAESAESSTKLAMSLNKITTVYMILTGVIAVSGAVQVYLALRN